MRHRLLTSAGSLVAVSVMVWLAGVVVAGQAPSETTTFTVPASNYTPPKTPWGDPDLQGVWDNHTNVPMERPANLAGRKTLTDAELAERDPSTDEPLCNQDDERCAKATVAQLDRLRAYNSFWTPLDYVYDNRTALIKDPQDGRIPPMTPEAITIQRAHNAAHPPTDPSTAVIEIRHWEDYDLAERCIAAQVPTTTMGYNSAQYLMQSPGWVMLAHERLNTRVIPLDGRPHLGGTMGAWMGDSRGHWEGNTLVVETTNYTNKTEWRVGGVLRRPWDPLHQLSCGRALRAGWSEPDRVLRHDQRSDDVDQALDLHAALGEGSRPVLYRRPRRRRDGAVPDL